MSAPKAELLQLIELALFGKWGAAHEVVQAYEDDVNAAWVRAVLHKLGGDLSNAHHWYRRADRVEHVAYEPLAELVRIRIQITSERHQLKQIG